MGVPGSRYGTPFSLGRSMSTAREDAVLDVVNRVGRVAIAHDRRWIEPMAVVEHAVVVDVRQRLQMRVRDAVIAHRDGIAADAVIFTSYGLGLSTAFTVSESADNDTPSRTRRAASRFFAGVIRLSVPISSALPHRPQLESSYFHCSYC
jgi:hypothetical protein